MGVSGLKHLFWLQCARSQTHVPQHHTALTKSQPRYLQRREGLDEESGDGVLETKTQKLQA